MIQREQTSGLKNKEWEPTWHRFSYYPGRRAWKNYLSSWNLRCLICWFLLQWAAVKIKSDVYKLLSTEQAYHKHSIISFYFKVSLTPAMPAHHMRLSCSLLLPLPSPESHFCTGQATLSNHFLDAWYLTCKALCSPLWLLKYFPWTFPPMHTKETLFYFFFNYGEFQR